MPKDNIEIAQRVLLKAKTVNVQSQVTAAEDVCEPFSDDKEDNLEDQESLHNKSGSGDNDDDPEWVSAVLETGDGGVGNERDLGCDEDAHTALSVMEV